MIAVITHGGGRDAPQLVCDESKVTCSVCVCWVNLHTSVVVRAQFKSMFSVSNDEKVPLGLMGVALNQKYVVVN